MRLFKVRCRGNGGAVKLFGLFVLAQFVTKQREVVNGLDAPGSKTHCRCAGGNRTGHIPGRLEQYRQVGLQREITRRMDNGLFEKNNGQVVLLLFECQLCRLAHRLRRRVIGEAKLLVGGQGILPPALFAQAPRRLQQAVRAGGGPPQ